MLVVDMEHASGAAKPVVPAAKVDGANGELPQGRGAHDARLNGDIEIGLAQDGRRVAGQDLRDCDEFRVSRAV